MESQPKVENSEVKSEVKPEVKFEFIETDDDYSKLHGFTLREYEEACFGKEYVGAKDKEELKLN
jgi:hypothetical protein